MSTLVKGIKIKSDGSVLGTRIFDSEGKDVTSTMQVRRVAFQHNAGELPTAVLECVCAEIDSTNLSCEVVQTARVVGTHGD